MAYATSKNGTRWKRGPGSLTKTTSAYASYGTAAIDAGGTPIVGVNASTTSQVTLHRGIDPSVPAAAADWTTKSGAYGCCAYDAALAQDQRNHQVWTAWFSSSSTARHAGVLVEKVYPKPVGKVLKAPKSSKGASTLDPLQDVAMAARKGGGVYVAYKIGYPTADHIGVWEVGTKHLMVIKAPGTHQITLQAGPQGRLWLASYSQSQNRIHVTRSNPSATRFGAVRTIRLPGSKYAYCWSLGGGGSHGPFHLLANITAKSGGKPQIYYQKVAPGLTLVAKPHQLDKGVVVAKVSDAGKAVAHAKVTFRGMSKQTNGHGVAKFRVPGSVHSGRYAMTAKKAGYFPGHASVKVT